MNSGSELGYRLELAEGYLREAEADYADGKWHGCLAHAQESVENAGKAVICCLAPVARTHDVARQLAGLLESAELPAELQQALASMLVDFSKMGLETHIRVTYGDEEFFVPPWRLIQQTEAETGLMRARKAVGLARRFSAHYSPPASPGAGAGEVP